MIAKTAASGGPGLDPRVLAFTSSLAADRAIVREDLAGSLAHLAMLARVGLVSAEDARELRGGLAALWDEWASGALALSGEEDVHMAIEAELSRRLGAVAGKLHTARSRNDQVALDLRLHVRERCGALLDALAAAVDQLADRAAAERDLVLPAYTHRQRAQAVTGAYLLCSHAEPLARDAAAFIFVLEQADACPLGVGAIAGTTLPIDREIPRTLLGFSRLTENGLDTVADRDFALDFAYTAARCLLHVGRIAAEFVALAGSDAGLVQLDGAIACGSSLMPQKRNPDVFELLRARGGRAAGNLAGLLNVLAGLPSGYHRDLQEDRAAVLDSGPLVLSALAALAVALDHVTFDAERCRAAVAGSDMQATDLAEALVRRGRPFREAYRAVGALVARCRSEGRPLASVTMEEARQVDPAFDTEALAAAEPLGSPARKVSAGGTGPASVEQQIASLKARAARIRARARAVPRLDELFARLMEVR